MRIIVPDVNKLLVCPARIVRGATTEMSSKAMTENRYPPFLAFVRAGPETLRNAMVTTDYYNSCCCSSTSSTRIPSTTQVVNPTTPALVCCRTSQKLMTTQIVKITPPLLLPPPPPAGVVVVRECCSSLLPQSLSQHVKACTALSSGMGEEHFEIHSFHETVSAAATYCTCQ